MRGAVRAAGLRAAGGQRRGCAAAAGLVTTVREGRVATVTLCRPDKLNMMDLEMASAFSEAVAALRADCAGLGAVVVTGQGRAFSAGGDLRFIMDRHEDTPERNAYVMRQYYDRFLCVRSLPVPVVAAINGHAIGAGLCLALACDVRVASREARLGATFVSLGLHPGMGATHLLPRLVGPQTAARLLLTGDTVKGDEAQQLGMVAEAVSPEEVVPRATALAGRMAAQGPVAVRSCVRTLRLAMDEGLDRALWREADAQSYCYKSSDLGEGVAAVKEKRSPQFADYSSYAFCRPPGDGHPPSAP